MSIEDWTPTLANVFETISGVELVHTYDSLPAVLRVFPCVVILPTRGPTANYSAGGPNIGVHQLQATVYVSAQILPEAYALAVPFVGRVTRALAANLKLDGLVAHAIPDPAGPWYEGPGAIQYGFDAQGAPLQHLGIIFRIEVKEVETFTVSA